MGKILIFSNKSGGEGGADVSVVTANASDVLVDKVIVGQDGEPILGEMPNIGAVSQMINAGSSYTIPKGYHNGSGSITAQSLVNQTGGTAISTDILDKKTAWVNGTQVTGAMPNKGAVSSNLNAGGSYTIPEGYHNGEGVIKANALSGQTSGTATAAQILKDQTAWVNGTQITGTMTDNGAVTPAALGAGGSYTIPAGYHNGSGKVTANTLASMTSAADAAAGQILKGKKAYVDGTLVTGTMPDNTTLTSNGTVPGINSTYASIPTREGSGLQYGKDTAGTARISLCPPEGYYQGGSASYVNRPAADFGNAATNQVISGATFTSSNGLKLTGTVSVQSVLSFNAAPYSTTQITFTWKNPAKGAFSGVIIVGKTGSSPTSVSDGTRWYKGSGNNTAANGSSTVTIGGFTIGTTYYFRCFAYAVKDNAEWVGGSLTANAKTTAKGSQTFTSSGTFTVPAAVRTIDIFVVGGGGSGGHSNGYSSQGNKTNAGGAGGGYTATKKAYAVTPGQTFAVTIGAGGPYTSGSSATGGTTSFGSVLSANGGNGGQGGRVAGNVKGGDGGSGGGGAGGSGSYATYAKGGSDGSDGVSGKAGTPGKGQGTTTRAFGESSNTLYAGGGGGYNSSSSGGGGAGGDGGGGAARTDGVANTGGGGGASGYKGSSYKAGAGGSGVCIVRWGY